MNLFDFNGGVHPPQHKDDSTRRAIASLPLVRHYAVALQQHAGAAAFPVVSVGQRVLKGETIAIAREAVSAAVHAPTSGVVRAIEPHPLPHPAGLADPCIVIESDGEDRWIARQPFDFEAAGRDATLAYIRQSGIVGLGGAAFPSAVKLGAGRRQSVPTLIVNGAECEPWITCDDMLMRERAAAVLRGAQLMAQLLESREIIVGIEENKDLASEALAQAARDYDNVTVIRVPTIYPMGGAKQLIKVLTGKETPSGGRSTDIGVACFNVGTAYAVARAIDHGEPLISRIVTVTGNVRRPQNFEALIGTPMQDVIAASGAPLDDTDGYLIGGPMMGFKLGSTTAPLTKSVNCVIATSPALFPPAPPALPCIRCTRCASACPADLQPQELYWFARGQRLDKAETYGIFDCIECGCCAYVCPSHIPLVDYYRWLKSEIQAGRAEKSAADAARERHELHLARLEREQREKAERHAQRIAAAQQQAAATPGPEAARATPADTAN